MNKALNTLRLFFCFFSGEDDYIIRRCSAKTQIFFAAVGALVIAIFIACWFSASHFISQLFEDSNKWISLPIGIFWALLVANLYLLLLYTVAPTTLPTSKYKKHFINDAKAKSALNASLVLRIFFVSLLAIIIAQPLNVMMLKSFASKSLETYKTEYKVNLLISADSGIISKEIETQKDYNFSAIAQRQCTPIERQLLNVLDDKVNNDKKFITDTRNILTSLKKIDSVSNKTSKHILKADSLRNNLTLLINYEIQSDDDFLNSIAAFSNDSSNINQAQLTLFKNELMTSINNKREHYNRIDTLLNNSNFYCKQIQILLAQSPLAWLITLLVIAAFIIPIRLKYVIRNKTNYYELKSDIEKYLVLTEYNKLKIDYTKTLTSKLIGYNDSLQKSIQPLLNKLKNVNPQLEENLKEQLATETSKAVIEKYEYWQDHPFRTKKKEEIKFVLNEYDLLTKIYI